MPMQAEATGTQTSTQPGTAQKAVFRTVSAVSTVKNKLNVPPGFHVLFCAIGATILGGGAMKIFDWLASPPETDEEKAKAEQPSLGFKIPKFLRQLKGSLNYRSELLLPTTMDEFEHMPEADRKKVINNELLHIAHKTIPNVFGGIGVFLGSKIFFRQRGTYSKLASYDDSNMLEANAKVHGAMGEAFGPLSALLMSTGGGSLRFLSGSVMTTRFGEMVQEFNALPGLTHILYGGNVPWRYNMSPLKIVNNVIIPHLAKVEDHEISISNLEDATASILSQFYGRSNVNEKIVNALVESMLEIRNATRSECIRPQGDLCNTTEWNAFHKKVQDRLTEALCKNWNDFFTEAQKELPADKKLRVEDAEMIGKGAAPWLGKLMAKGTAAGKIINETVKNFREAAQATKTQHGLA